MTAWGGGGGRGGGREGKMYSMYDSVAFHPSEPYRLLVATPTYYRPHPSQLLPPPCSHTHLPQVPPTSLFLLTMGIHLLTLSETSW